MKKVTFNSKASKVLGAVGASILISGVSVGATYSVMWSGQQDLDEVYEMASCYVESTGQTIASSTQQLEDKQAELETLEQEYQQFQSNSNNEIKGL